MWSRNKIDQSIAAFTGVGGNLEIDGWNTERLVARAGRTPLLAYSAKAARTRCEDLRAALPGAVTLSFSIKASPFPGIVHTLASLVDMFDVASVGELRLALNCGIKGARCVFTGPGKSKDEIAAAVASDARVFIESAAQLKLVIEAAEKLGVKASVGIRLAAPPEISIAPRGYVTTQFGMEIAQAGAVVDTVERTGLNFAGFHCHWGSRLTDEAQIAKDQALVFRRAMEIYDHSRFTGPRSVTLGGGFNAAFYDGDVEPNVTRIGSLMSDWMAGEDLSNTRIHVELGRYITAPCGVYICQVLDTKVINNERFVVADGGLHHLMLAADLLGSQRNNMLVRPTRAMRGGDQAVVNIVGRLCTGLDRLAHRIPFPAVSIGDHLAIFNAGAYGPSFSPGGFLSHPEVVELLV